VLQPPPRPTPLVQPAAQQAQSKAQEIAQRARSIPGVNAVVMGNAVKISIFGNSFSEIAQKIMQLPAELQNTPTKTICDGEPIRITSIQGPMITPAGFGTFEARPRKT
jgi:hypothetical protein